MRIFHNPKDRKGLEANEQKVNSPVVKNNVKQVKDERVESKPARSTSSEAEPTEEKRKEKAAPQKEGEKKEDTTV